MSDKAGLKAAAEKGIKLGEVGQRIVFENDHVRIWEINLEPGQVRIFICTITPTSHFARRRGE